ncbi:hypothetical protein [Dyadobacter fanqingshengii]|uniref:Aerotolerance regulator N-terminal domain-containing protein n=1 Tax=Dyadobacter fanqingshengii TaxID=2906443 RepID=A0A9X1PA41_9BACT|nr:hypothetical protein [Dyadobacter fanqingshengii]MCF0040138.1 hypothetical protein [Dyadobacter fanqingshengii]USJ38110.1 hypothetical protein NFI81_10045 [Dyadobacter fanqingshengii]
MIQFDFNWSEPLNLIILAFAIALLPLQLWLILPRNNNKGFTTRDGIRLALNVLLWVALIAFIIQPYLLSEAKSVTGLFVGKDVPAAKANALKDSITSLKKAVSSDFKNPYFDTLILAGQDFPPEMFSTIMRAPMLPNDLQWIPYFAADQLHGLHWKGIVRKGEMQVLQGHVNSSEKQVLKLIYGNETLDSTVLNTGFNQFRLQFPVFSEGRAVVELVLDDHLEDTIRFFARPSEKITFQFILDSPDFESRALANWLGKSGHSVIYSATLSKDIRSQQTINKAKDPEVIITDAGNAGNGLVKKALATGKSVLFINLTDPAAEIKAINAALGTQFNVSRISTKESVPLSPGLTALPFRFAPGNRYLISETLPVAVEKGRGKVGVSLLNETFPLQLTGDSVAYQKVWDAVLAPVLPVAGNNVEVEAPLFENMNAEISLNGFSKVPEFLKIGADTLFTNNSPLNPKSAKTRFKPTESGWTRAKDSLNMEMYVEDQTSASNIYKAARLIDFVKSYHIFQEKRNGKSALPNPYLKGVRKEFSDWMWFALLIFCFLAVWIERKL